jgi:hypothetical protein
MASAKELGRSLQALLTTALAPIIGMVIMAIPATIAWNCVAPKYLSFIPMVYHYIPYWHMLAILIVISYVGICIKRLMPSIFSNSE